MGPGSHEATVDGVDKLPCRRVAVRVAGVPCPLRSATVATGPIVDTSVRGVDPYLRWVALAIRSRDHPLKLA
jgi:hypothetical protein